MVISDTGIILRTRLLTETSLIVQWLTRDHGRLSTVARGARRPKSPFLGKLDLFYSGDLSFVPSRRSDLHTLREVRLLGTRPHLRLELACLQQAAYAAALVEQTTEPDTPIPEVFYLVEDFLGRVAPRPAHAAEILSFELRLLAHLGLAPDPDETRLPEPAREMLREFLILPRPASTKPWDATAVRAVDQFLHGFLIRQFGKLARGRASALRPL